MLLVPDEAGLPVVPVSPVLEVLGEVLEPVVPEVEPLALPVVEPEVDGEVVVSVELEVVGGVVLLVVLDGDVDEVELVLPVWFLSQPARAAPARRRAAATGMSFFMTSPIGLWDLRNRACARTVRATASRAL